MKQKIPNQSGSGFIVSAYALSVSGKPEEDYLCLADRTCRASTFTSATSNTSIINLTCHDNILLICILIFCYQCLSLLYKIIYTITSVFLWHIRCICRYLQDFYAFCSISARLFLMPSKMTFFFSTTLVLSIGGTSLSLYSIPSFSYFGIAILW